jgi:EmrB/QacA subfamily drug resistance transporter
MDATPAAEAVKPLTHRELRLIVLGVLLPLFMGAIDQTILATALPTIGRHFDDVHNLPWLITIYLLAATAGMPLYGKLADIHGRRFTLRIAIAFHIVGSLVCALAPSMLVLIIGRILQGIGGAGLSSISIVVLGDVAAPKERGRYYGYFSMTYTTAGACGPALGGFLADHVHWSAIFWLNIPLGLLALLVTSTLLRRLPRYDRPHRLDVVGAALIVAASVSFMLGLNIAGVRYPWLSLPVLALFACALAMGCFFVLWLTRAPEPLIPIAILANPIVRWAVTANGFGWASIVGLNIFLPMYLQSVVGLSPTDAGLSLIVLMAALNTSAGLAGQVLGRVKHYKALPIAAFTIAITAVLVLAFRVDSLNLFWFQILLLLIGIGFGPMPSVASVSIQNTVARHQLGIALGTMSFTRNLLSTMQVAALAALVLTANTSLGQGGGGVRGMQAAEAAIAFQRVFFAVAACLAVSFIALVMIEERPLGTDHPQTKAPP